jgi:hypothetical protein
MLLLSGIKIANKVPHFQCLGRRVSAQGIADFDPELTGGDVEAMVKARPTA